MLAVDDTIPDATVWLGPRQSITLHEIAAEGRAVFLFYPFDWSAT